MITRRNFLKAGAAVAALSVVPNGFASILAKKEKAIGVQLYSVRDDLKTDFDGTMKALVDIGYKRMEAAGYRDGKFYGKSPAEMKKYLADLGARMVGSHTGSGQTSYKVFIYLRNINCKIYLIFTRKPSVICWSARVVVRI